MGKMENKTCILLLNLMLESGVLKQGEEAPVIAELNKMATDKEYRKHCAFRDYVALSFLRMEEEYLHNILFQLFTWSQTNQNENFWRVIAERFKDLSGEEGYLEEDYPEEESW